MTSKLIDNKHTHVRLCDIQGTGITADGSGRLPVASVVQLGTGGDISDINPLPITNLVLDSIVVSGGNVCTNIQVLPVTGTQGNAWNNEAVLLDGTSNAADCQFCNNISVFGVSDTATNITPQISQNGGTWYDSGSNIFYLLSPGNFHFSFTSAARYIRLKSSAAATITATIAAK